VNSPFLLTNSLVPSRGSTSQKQSHFFLSEYGIFLPSSDKIGMFGNLDNNPDSITKCEFLSA
tara:strand:+ start:99 stop:284 length:186 start_codon:yes stop_codon:yes gene_type:complete